MADDPNVSNRKQDHIRINLDRDVSSSITTGLERLRFIHQALPELDMEAVDLSQQLFGKRLNSPILISSMTGGTEQAGLINRRLAEAAQETRVAMGLGSMRAALIKPETLPTFQVRQWAPDILLFANLGAIQLNYGYSVDECRKVVDLVQADALILHLNPLQEALQPEGNTRFGALLKKIERVCRDLQAPVIIKEVGWGISAQAAGQLMNAGIAAIDVAGAGGTSWSQVEMYRISDESRARVAGAFRGWGIPTVESIRMVRSAAGMLKIFASGGLKDGIDIAKCIALGADLGGMAGPFLKAADVSTEAACQMIREISMEIQICMFAAGAGCLADLKNVPLMGE